MPRLVDMIPPDPNERAKFDRAQEFWANASAYAAQAAPYGVERMAELDQMAGEIEQGMSMAPPEIQQKIIKKLKEKLIDPVEGDTAQEYDSAWSALQSASKQLHKDLMPSMGQMGQMQGGGMPQGPHTMPDGTMMAL